MAVSRRILLLIAEDVPMLTSRLSTVTSVQNTTERRIHRVARKNWALFRIGNYRICYLAGNGRGRTCVITYGWGIAWRPSPPTRRSQVVSARAGVGLLRAAERVAQLVVDLRIDPAAAHEGRQDVEVREKHDRLHELGHRPTALARRLRLRQLLKRENIPSFFLLASLLSEVERYEVNELDDVRS